MILIERVCMFIGTLILGTLETTLDGTFAFFVTLQVQVVVNNAICSLFDYRKIVT